MARRRNVFYGKEEDYLPWQEGRICSMRRRWNVFYNKKNIILEA